MYNRNTNTISLIVQSPIAPRSNNVLWDDGTSIKIWRKGIWVPIGGGGTSDSYWGYDEVDNTVFITGYNKVQINCDLVVNGNISSKNWNAMWELSEDGTQIFTTKQVLIKNSLIVEGDTSSGGAGEDTPGYGASSMSQLEDVDLSSLGNNYVLIYDSSSSKWVSKPQSEIVPDLSGYLKIEDANTTFVKLNTFNTLSIEVSTLNTKVTLVHDWYNAISPYWYYDTELEAIVCTKNLIVYLDTSSGGEGEDTPASGIRGIYVNGTPYTDTDGDGFIDLGTISGGVSEITASMITSALGYTPANGANYLPLTGGTIESTSTSAPLIIKTASNGWLMFRNTAGYLGEFGFTYEKIAHCTDTNGNARTLIHSGNIGSYAFTTAAKTLTSSDTLDAPLTGIYGYKDANNPTNSFGNNAAVLSLKGVKDTPVFQLAFDGNATSVGYRNRNYAGTWSTWKTIAFTDSNVASATKLQTARTIWGQSFDGTGNVSGALKTPSGYNAVTILDSYLVLGQGMAENSLPTYLDGYNVYMRYGKSSTIGLILNSSGNVVFAHDIILNHIVIDGSNDIYSDNGLWIQPFGGGEVNINYLGTNTIINQGEGNVGIGTTSPSYKLDVAGTGRFTGAVTMSSTLSVGGNITPSANNSYTLGTSSYQWSTIYGVNGIFSGDTSSGSDIRFKDIIKNKTIKIEHIAKAPLFTFKWNDREDDTIHLGSSAQYWEKVCPWIVTGEDFKSLNYATLGVAMGISLAKKAVNHEARIKELEKEIKRLKEEMRYGG